MKFMYLYRIWDVGDSNSNGHTLETEIRKQIDVCSWMLGFDRKGDGSFVLLAYEMDKPVDPEEHFKKVTNTIGPLSDKTGRKLPIEMFGSVNGTMTAPDSCRDKCAECPDCPTGCADCDEDNEDDEWADVLRLRDLGTKH